MDPLTVAPPNEADLLLRAGAGDRDAFRRLFELYAPRVRVFLVRGGVSADRADELVQDVFVDACKDLDRIRNREAVRSWLAICTIRRARRRLRRRRLRHMLGLDEPVDYEAVADRGATPPQRALLRRVYEVLDELPVEQRLAWTLRHIEGEPLEHVARLCGCSLATAKRRISEAGRRILARVS